MKRPIAQAQTSAVPSVVIVGRPNVGKSTLFNRLTQSRRALMSEVPGTTRDWIEGYCHWGKHSFRMIDTGGYAPGNDAIMSSVRAQVERWVKTADAVLWIVDGQQGLMAADREISRWLRGLARRVVIVANKIDDAKSEDAIAEFHQLGFDDVWGVSASHGRSVNKLLDHLEELLQPQDAPSDNVLPLNEARVAIIGRPNVGKSSLLNRILGEERAIVSDIPGTTRDTIDTLVEWEGRRFLFTDTAGLRANKSDSSEGLEGLTRIMAEKALERSNVALLILDSKEGLSEGDVAVARLIEHKNRACIVGINKWDLIDDKSKFMQWYREHQSTDMPFLSWAPQVFISALTGLHVPELLQLIWNAHTQFHRAFDNAELEAFFWSEIQERPYSYHGRKLMFKTAQQIAGAPPIIAVRGNMLDQDVHFSYHRHLENRFRERYGVIGTPIKFRFQRK